MLIHCLGMGWGVGGESIGNWGLTATTGNWVSGYRKEVIEARHPSETKIELGISDYEQTY